MVERSTRLYLTFSAAVKTTQFSAYLLTGAFCESISAIAWLALTLICVLHHRTGGITSARRGHVTTIQRNVATSRAGIHNQAIATNTPKASDSVVNTLCSAAAGEVRARVLAYRVRLLHGDMYT